MCIYDIIDELMNINEIECKTSNQIFSETFHDNSMRFSAITLFNYAQYYSIKSRPLSMTFNGHHMSIQNSARNVLMHVWLVFGSMLKLVHVEIVSL